MIGLWLSPSFPIPTSDRHNQSPWTRRQPAKVVEFLERYDASENVGADVALRLGVRGGGCSGFQYQMAFDAPTEDDICFESEGQTIIVSRDALPYVAGSRIVWAEGLMTEGFSVENPNATASCGCGSSFRADPNAAGCSVDEGPPSSGDAVHQDLHFSLAPTVIAGTCGMLGLPSGNAGFTDRPRSHRHRIRCSRRMWVARFYRVECARRDSEHLVHLSADHLLSAGTTIPVLVELSDETIFLVGFSSPDRRELYRALRGVSGIGRRSAILVLDCGEATDTLRAVAGKDVGYFQNVPGLGKAKIGAIFLELAKRYRDTLPAPLPLPVSMWVDARDGLIQTGQTFEASEHLLRNATTAMDTHPASAEELLALATQN